MKRFLSVLLAMTMICAFAASAMAFTQTAIQGNNEVVASVFPVQVSIGTQWRNRSDNGNVTQGSFGGIHPDVTPVKSAGQYLFTTINANNLGWGACVYVRNRAADANPKFTGIATADTPVGLVHMGDTKNALSMKWAVTPPSAPAPADNWTDVENWRWLLDPTVNETDFHLASAGDSLRYATFLNAQKVNEYGGNSVNLYFLVNFTGAVSGNYKTNTLTIESYFN